MADAVEGPKFKRCDNRPIQKFKRNDNAVRPVLEEEKQEGGLSPVPLPAPPQKVEEHDDGMRFKCSACETYVKPDPEGSGMKCEECSQWFTLCSKCMPDVDSYSNEAVWLCPECR